MTPQEFYDACEKFDWFFEYSDDFSVWRRERTNHAALLAHTLGRPDLLAIYDAWFAFMFSGDAFGKPKAPKPERPVE